MKALIREGVIYVRICECAVVMICSMFSTMLIVHAVHEERKTMRCTLLLAWF